MAGAKVPLLFKVYKGETLVREELLNLSVIKLGKISPHLKLDDESVSRMHAIIEVNGPQDITIIDLGSAKGTFVNGQKVNKAKLQSGDSIVIGETRIDMAIVSEAEASAPRGAVAHAASGPAYMPPAASGFDAGPTVATPPVPAAVPAAPTMMAAPGGQYGAPPPRPAPSTGNPFGAAPASTGNPFGAAPAPQAAPSPGFGGGYAAPAAPAFGASAPAFTGAPPIGAPSYDQGSGAVEVAAMIGNSVVHVKHCIAGRTGKVTSGTKLMFAVNASLLLISAMTFYMAYRTAVFNHAKYEQWVEVERKPAYGFRPRMVGTLSDMVMFGSLALGLVGLIAATARMRKDKEAGPQFRIGSDPDVEYPLNSAPASSFPMVQPRGKEFYFNFAPGMEGELMLDGRNTSLGELSAQGQARPSSAVPGAFEMAIPPRSKIRVRSGLTTFMVSAVAEPKRYAGGAAFDSSTLVYIMGSAIVQFGFIFLLQYVFNSSKQVTLDGDIDEQASARSATVAQDDPPPEKVEETNQDGQEESGGTGTAMALDEGKMGKKDSDRAEGQYKMEKTADQEQLARQAAVEEARTAGILGAPSMLSGGAFASLTGTGDISSGFDDQNVFGGLLGNEAGEMNGGFGFGRSGFGPGGGGTGWGTIGTGRYGTIGHGSGTGSGYGIGGGRGGGRGHAAAVPVVSIGQPDAQGDLDKSIIKRYIKRNESKIVYCYEKQLLAKPSLSGTVSTQFFISPNGTVASASGNGVDGEVAKCVASVIKSIEFPKPKGGGGVQVNYPFTFRQASGN